MGWGFGPLHLYIMSSSSFGSDHITKKQGYVVARRRACLDRKKTEKLPCLLCPAYEPLHPLDKDVHTHLPASECSAIRLLCGYADD